MPAIEYGSFYWCVVLNGKNGEETEYVHLHSDEIAIEANGSLTFRSVGRRAAGTEPKKADEKPEDKKHEQASNNGDQGATSEKGEKEGGDGKEQKPGNMIYVSFAPGSWKAVYAAKLQDGSPVSIEHWNMKHEKDGDAVGLYPNSGACGIPAGR
jgi:hypothetical protein